MSGGRLVREIGRLDVDMVWLWIFIKLDCLNIRAILQGGLHDPMHPIHDATVSRQDDGVRQIRFIHQPQVIHGLPAGQMCFPLLTPVGFVELANRVQRDGPAR